MWFCSIEPKYLGWGSEWSQGWSGRVAALVDTLSQRGLSMSVPSTRAPGCQEAKTRLYAWLSPVWSSGSPLPEDMCPGYWHTSDLLSSKLGHRPSQRSVPRSTVLRPGQQKAWVVFFCCFVFTNPGQVNIFIFDKACLFTAIPEFVL